MRIQNINPILALADGYKFGQDYQYPPDMKAGFSYIESRGGRFPETVFFGLQAELMGYFTQRITREHIDEASFFLDDYFPPAYAGMLNEQAFQRIVDRHGGYWPVRIKAVPEGSVVPTGNALVSLQSTDDQLPWVHQFLETTVLRSVWYMTTVASVSFHAKRIIKRYLDLTSDAPEAELPFKLHDFGARAASSLESAGRGGMAHLVNFQGTDTVAGILAARQFYDAQCMPGHSIPASEHSTMTSWGRENEPAAYANMIARFGKPGGIFACVSDSYDIMNAVENLWGGELRQRVIDSGATLVVRPDSGDPVETPIQVIEKLGERFGYTLNSKGYKVLNHVRVIQGDGVDLGAIETILSFLTLGGWSASNIAFGMGGRLLQAGIDRDTQKFAQKQSAVHRDGHWVDTYKDPVGDKGKASKRGLLGLTRSAEGYKTERLGVSIRPNLLVPVYDTGWFAPWQRFEMVQARASASL